MRPYLLKLFSILLVLSALVLPAAFRIDIWPWSTYPMFAFDVNVGSLWIYRVHLRRKADGAEALLPLSLRIKEWDMLSRHLMDGNRRVVQRLLEAEAYRWPEDIESYSHLVLYRARKKEGDANLAAMDMEKILEFPIESQ